VINKALEELDCCICLIVLGHSQFSSQILDKDQIKKRENMYVKYVDVSLMNSLLTF